MERVYVAQCSMDNAWRSINNARKDNDRAALAAAQEAYRKARADLIYAQTAMIDKAWKL